MGRDSQIRQWAGIKTNGWKYWQSCLTFMITHEAPRNDIAFERFWPDGPMGVLPLTGNRYHIVWTAPHNEAKALQTLDELEFFAKVGVLHRWIPGQTDPRQRATAVSGAVCFRVSIMCDLAWPW